MARQHLQRLLLPFLNHGRPFSTAKFAARSGEEVVSVSNAHKAPPSVLEVRV